MTMLGGDIASFAMPNAHLEQLDGEFFEAGKKKRSNEDRQAESTDGLEYIL